MLREAWDSLSAETQMRILFRITGDRDYPENLEILEKALSSPNPYIRYLAARSSWLLGTVLGEDPLRATLRERLRGDSSDLVQGGMVHRDAYSELVGLGPDPEQVCALPVGARVTLIGRVKHPADWFPKVARRALAHAVPPGELLAMTREYLAGHIESKAPGTGLEAWGERDAQRGLSELWRLAAQLVEKYPESARLLIHRLPTRTRDSHGECIPDDALSAFSQPALAELLRRPDIDLSEFRAYVLIRPEATSDELLEAAASRSVAMTAMQFAVLLTLPERIPALEYAEGFPLVMMKALKDCYRFKYGNSRFGELTDYSEETFRRQVSLLPMRQRREIIKELRKYQLATILAPWPNQPPPIDEPTRSAELLERGKPWSVFVTRLQRPKSLAVPGDPWATYCNFGGYFDIRENYEALKSFSSGYYLDEVADAEGVV
jgi:hypothetical protein